MGLWKMVTDAWRIVLKNPVIIAVVGGINIVLGLLVLPFVNEINQAGRAGQMFALGMAAVQFFFIPFLQGGCLGFASNRLGGQGGSPLAAFLDGAKRLYRRLLAFEALTVAVIVLLVVVSILLFTISMAPAAASPGLSIAAALVSSVPVALALYLLIVILSFAPVSMAVDGANVFGAVKRALALGRPAVGQMLLLSLLLALTLVPAFLIAGIPEFIEQAGTHLGLAGLLLGLVLQSLAGALSMVLFLAGYMLLFRRRAGST